MDMKRLGKSVLDAIWPWRVIGRLNSRLDISSGLIELLRKINADKMSQIADIESRVDSLLDELHAEKFASRMNENYLMSRIDVLEKRLREYGVPVPRQRKRTDPMKG